MIRQNLLSDAWEVLDLHEARAALAGEVPA
jgi:hypothetical protein